MTEYTEDNPTKESGEEPDNIDKENMKSVLEEFPGQVKKGFELGGNIKAEEEIDKIVITGMGGSALPGEILRCYLDSKIPVFVNKDYQLPEFVNSKTLVFAISYSGNTEETIYAYRTALRKGCSIVAIASGGKLDILARKQGIPLISIPRGMQPRSSYGFIFFSILRVLQNSGLIENIEKDIQLLEKALEKKDMFHEKGEEFADLLVDKIPLIYSSQSMYAVAYKWKINFNENSKIHAFCNVFPEMNHNELVGYTNPNGDYYVIILKNDEDYHKVKLRMDITKELIKKKKVPVTEIEITGANQLIKMFSAIYIGDWVSYYLAIKNRTDPTPVVMVEDLKRNIP